MVAALPVRRLTGFLSLSPSPKCVFQSRRQFFTAFEICRPSGRYQKAHTLRRSERNPVSPPPPPFGLFPVTAFRANAALGRGCEAPRSIFRLRFRGAPCTAPGGVTVCHYLRPPENVSPPPSASAPLIAARPFPESTDNLGGGLSD